MKTVHIELRGNFRAGVSENGLFTPKVNGNVPLSLVIKGNGSLSWGITKNAPFHHH